MFSIHFNKTHVRNALSIGLKFIQVTHKKCVEFLFHITNFDSHEVMVTGQKPPDKNPRTKATRTKTPNNIPPRTNALITKCLLCQNSPR